MKNNQLIAFEKFKKLKVVALFMEMGTGKTKVALDLVNYNNVDYLIYVTPYSTISNVESEIQKWKVNCNYTIVGYETISSSNKKYLDLLENIDNKKVFIIADESIFIKNEDSKRFKRLCEIRKKCTYALVLNGTPITKNEWDLYNQMEFLSPLILKMDRIEFLNTFFKKIKYKKKGQQENEFYVFSEVNASYLQKLIDPYIFKCKLDLNIKENETYYFVPYEDDDNYYSEKKKQLEKYIEKRNSSAIINMLSILNYTASTYPKKNDLVINYIKHKQVIVFCCFLSEIEYISQKLDCYVIHGGIKKRKEIIENFKNDNKPLIMTYGVGSYSLNLQFCNEIIFTSLNFDYGKIEQSKYRIKRIGQEKNIKYTYFLTDLGINKLIIDNLKKKQNLGNLIKEKLQKGDDIEWLKSI